MINILLPLPPLPEQQRIVAKIDELVSVCDELEVRLKQAQAGADRLVEVIVSRLLGRDEGVAEVVAEEPEPVEVAGEGMGQLRLW